MNPKQFLLVGGVVLLLLGIVGYLGVFNTADSAFYLTNAENLAHTVLGIVAIAAAYVLKDAGAQKWLVVLVSLIAIFFSLYTLVVQSNPVPNTFNTANLENPADLILHLVVGAWGLLVSFRPAPAAA